MSSTASGVTVTSVQDANINASPVNLSSAIVDLNHVLRRRSIEKSVPLMQRSLAKWSEL